MSLKDQFARRTLELLQHPKVMKLLSNEQIMNSMMAGLRTRGRFLDSFDEKTAAIAGHLNLATKHEVRELKRTIRRLQQELEQANSED